MWGVRQTCFLGDMIVKILTGIIIGWPAQASDKASSHEYLFLMFNLTTDRSLDITYFRNGNFKTFKFYGTHTSESPLLANAPTADELS